MRDPFAVMGLPPSATPGEIRARYRQLARQHHPDAGPTGSSQRMAEINRAHDELTRDLEGCRRRATRGRHTSSTGFKSTRSAPPRRSRPQSRAAQWQEWLDRARRATSTGEPGRPRRPVASTPLRVSPSILTVCRHHGSVELRVRGHKAHMSKVLFSSRHFDVARGPATPEDQIFRVRLTGDLAAGQEASYLRVRTGGAMRRVPVYEFSCPSAEGSCAFAS